MASKKSSPKKDSLARLNDAARARLVQEQVALRGARFPVVILVDGFDGAGKGEVVQLLNEWLDPRGVETVSFHKPSDEERERPEFWRYWRQLPPRGCIAIFMSAWNTTALELEAYGKHKPARFERTLQHICNFESMVAADGALIIKLWLHLEKKAQRRRLTKLEHNPSTRWRVSGDDWRHHAAYDEFSKLSAQLIKTTDKPNADWTVIDSSNESERNLAVAKTIASRIAAHLRAHAGNSRPAPKATAPKPLKQSGRSILQRVDLKQTISEESYKEQRATLLPRLNRLALAAEKSGRSVIIVFEGWDAAGKGGAIRRLVSAIDPRFYRVIPIGAPTPDEHRYHYLWRFWRHLPRAGTTAIFDRSWYGRVLVERVEGFCTEAEWRRAYAEINDFEAQLVEHGDIVVKFWLHISAEEQLRRFRAREESPHKQHKMNAEDWRNRGKWPAYEVCVGDMIALTNSTHAPWHLIAANDKRHARLAVLTHACNAIEAALD